MHYHRLLRFAGNCASAALLMIVATSADTLRRAAGQCTGKRADNDREDGKLLRRRNSDHGPRNFRSQ
jgi:hypothetical protein